MNKLVDFALGVREVVELLGLIEMPLRGVKFDDFHQRFLMQGGHSGIEKGVPHQHHQTVHSLGIVVVQEGANRSQHALQAFELGGGGRRSQQDHLALLKGFEIFKILISYY